MKNCDYLRTGQSTGPQETCTRPCRAAVRCVLMECSTCLEAIMPGGTPTGFVLSLSSFINDCVMGERGEWSLNSLSLSICSADLPHEPESPNSRLGRHEGS